MKRAGYIVLALAPALFACEPDDRPTMRPGEDCITCHRPGDQAESVPWTVAGTIFSAPDAGLDQGVENVHVLIEDALGKKVKLTTNRVGNFYSLEPLDLKDGLISVVIEYQGHCREMELQPSPAYVYSSDDNDDAPLANASQDGVGCNHCHTLPDRKTAPGRLAVPQFFEALGDAQGCPSDFSNP